VKNLVSILLPVYQGELFLAESINSILNQSYDNFELIIINDGSTDKTGDIIAGYKDKRISVVTQKNKGLVESLNIGIKMTKSEYIARQDADDISEPTRLEKQVNFLESHKNVVMAGCSMKVVDMSSAIMHEHRVLLNNPELKQELLMRSPFAHGSVMMRKDAVIKAGGYRKDEWPAEDYGLWLRMAEFGDFANLDEPLYIYRENTVGISASNSDLQNSKTIKIQDEAWLEAKKLLAAGTINLTTYNNLSHGQQRIKRILNTSAWIAKKSIRMRQPVVFTRTVKSISASPVTYRKIAGRIRRRIKPKK
jgi:glycosyltransferase involved in cell wall biosynthesis